VSNLKQIGLGVHQYADDNHETFPCRDSTQLGKAGPFENYALGLGGIDPETNHSFMAPATNRPLYCYVGKSAVFHCPSDQGQNEGYLDFWNDNGIWKPSNFGALGCSYRLNAALWGTIRGFHPTIRCQPGRKKGRLGARPVRFILVHEPPAFWYDNYYHWHYARVPQPSHRRCWRATARNSFDDSFCRWSCQMPRLHARAQRRPGVSDGADEGLDLV